MPPTIQPADYTALSLDSVDRSDDSFLLRFNRPEHPEGLLCSIEAIGVLNPPTVLRRDNDSFSIVCGFARIGVLRELGEKTATVRLAPRDASPMDLLRMAIADNMASRGLNVAEQAMALRIAEKHLAPEAVARDILPLLGHPPALPVCERLRSCLELPVFLRVALVSGSLPEGLLSELARFKPAESEALAECLLQTRMTFAMSKEFLRLAREIAKRDGVDPIELLPELGYEKGKPAGNTQALLQERARLLERARERRFPILSRLRESSDAALKALGLDPGVTLRPPKDFEGDDFLLQARVSDFESFRRAVLHLSRQLDENPDRLREIFDLRWSE